MSSLAVVRQGSQRPRNLHRPPGRVSSSGGDVAEFAEDAGLYLDDWQRWVLDEALSERADRRWAAFEVCLIVPRQNGKGSILEALELYHLFVLGSQLIIHSAHEFNTAREHYLRMQALITANEDLEEQVEYFHISNADQSIKLKSGARLKFVARSRASVRGFSGDLIILDEAYKLGADALGAMGPALSARDNPQIWYTSSAPHADSDVLHNLRNRMLAGDELRLWAAEWGNDPGAKGEDAMAAANPGWPHRLTPENLDAELAMLGGLGDEYDRERLGIPSAPDLGAGVFPAGAWAACADPESKISSTRTVALDVAPNMTFSSFGAAGEREDGLLHVELIEQHPGTGWVIDRAKHLAERWGPILIDPRSPAGGLLEELGREHVPTVEVGDGQLARACAAIQEKVIAGTVRHIGQHPLDAAVAAAAIRPAGDAWRWSRTSSSADISPLVAVTLAAGARTGPKPPNVWNTDELLEEG